MILVDYSGIAMAAIFADSGFQQAAKNPSQESKDLLKHMILNSIRSHQHKNRSKYGQLVICADGQQNWRRDVFPEYKAARRKGKNESPVDWSFVYEVLGETLNDFRDNFPYPILHHPKAEGDDCIAIATAYAKKHMVKSVGLFEESEPILIIASDKDYLQLQKLGGVDQYSPMKKGMLKSSDPTRDLMEKILCGDAGDGVPNILSDDDTFIVEGKRQKPFKKSRIEEFLKASDPEKACQSQTELRNFQRNRQVISFDYIPEYISVDVIEQLKPQLNKKPNRMAIMNYLVTNRMKELLKVVDQF